jgi:hypothetical protein
MRDKREGVIKMGPDGPNGRYTFYAFDGAEWEITSGNMIELWDGTNKEFVLTRIEYSHEKKRYYAVTHDDLFHHDRKARM